MGVSCGTCAVLHSLAVQVRGSGTVSRIVVYRKHKAVAESDSIGGCIIYRVVIVF